MNLYKKCTAKPYYFLVIDATLASNDPSSFRRNLLQRIQKIIIATDDKIRKEKLPYDINGEVGKLSTLSSCKINKYEYLTGEEILLSNHKANNRTS